MPVDLQIGAEVIIDDNAAQSDSLVAGSPELYDTGDEEMVSGSQASVPSNKPKNIPNKNSNIKERILEQMEKAWSDLSAEKDSDPVDLFCESLKPSLRLLSAS